uniref:Uncharacterized AAA domain-containing protein ycf46 n=1 Tax=Acrochaetium secundatum TaxID=209631 RepID=A0A4D6BJX1_9FLOR|nr:hypothetical protein [Acrochaetium secundatum]QBX88352.1 hypothetical protein [Acrochaetium secundatum]
MDYQKELSKLIKSSCSFIYTVTSEEERLEYLLKQIVSHDISQSIQIWNYIDGYETLIDNQNKASRNPLEALNVIDTYNTNSDAIFFLRDFHVFLNDHTIARKIQNLSRKLNSCNQTILISALELKLPTSLTYIATIFILPLPNQYEIQIEIIRLLKLIQETLNPDLIEQLVSISRGLSIMQLRMIFSKIIVGQKSFSKLAYTRFIIEKQKQLGNNNFLELCQNNVSLQDIGGIYKLKHWLIKRSNCFSKTSLNYGIPYPKGLLLMGIQGTGKSLTAKSISSIFNLPLLKLDMGKIFGGIVGESENNIRDIIKISEASAPCILWIDEIDKAFNKQSNVTDSGTSSRVLGTFLTWLSDKNSSVFVVATANNIKMLPPEIVRKGRFDEIFFIDLPSYSERDAIFKVHLKQLRPKTWHRYNTQYLAKYSRLFSGAEIRQVILEAMHNAFSQNKEFSTDDILNAINSIIPLAFTDYENIMTIKKWANLGKSRLAS